MMWYWGGAVPYLEKFYMMGVLGGVESKFWCLTQFHTLTFWGGGIKKTTLYVEALLKAEQLKIMLLAAKATKGVGVVANVSVPSEE